MSSPLMLPELTSGRGWCKWATTEAGGTPTCSATSWSTITSGLPATRSALIISSHNCNNWRLETRFLMALQELLSSQWLRWSQITFLHCSRLHIYFLWHRLPCGTTRKLGYVESLVGCL